MSPATIDPHWRSMIADDERSQNWAEYVTYWLQGQTPRPEPVRQAEALSIQYDDLPWATTCLQDLFNG